MNRIKILYPGWAEPLVSGQPAETAAIGWVLVPCTEPGRAELMTRLEGERVPYDAEYPVGSGVFHQVRPDEPEALRDVPAEAEALRRVLAILEHKGGMAALRALQTVSERLGKRPVALEDLTPRELGAPDLPSFGLRSN